MSGVEDTEEPAEFQAAPMKVASATPVAAPPVATAQVVVPVQYVTTTTAAVTVSGSCCSDFWSNCSSLVEDAMYATKHMDEFKRCFKFGEEEAGDLQITVRFLCSFYALFTVAACIVSAIFCMIFLSDYNYGFQIVLFGGEGAFFPGVVPVIINSAIVLYCFAWAGWRYTWQGATGESTGKAPTPNTCQGFPCCGAPGWLLLWSVGSGVSGIMNALGMLVFNTVTIWDIMDYKFLMIVPMVLLVLGCVIQVFIGFYGFKLSRKPAGPGEAPAAVGKVAPPVVQLQMAP